MGNNIDLNSLSISELEQMVRDIDNYISSGIERYHYHQKPLTDLLHSAKVGEINSPEYLEVGQVYAIAASLYGDYDLTTGKLFEIEKKGINRYFLEKEYICETAICHFSVETYDVKGEKIETIISKNNRIILNYNYRKNKRENAFPNIIWSLDKIRLDEYYKSLSEALQKSLVSNKEADRKLQLANWKKQEIKEKIKQRQTTLFDGDQSEHERLEAKYGNK